MDNALQAAMLERAKREKARRISQSYERGFGAAVYDNLFGNPDDGVQSYGEQLGTWLNRAGETMTLGTVGDEASAAAGSLLPGRTYESELTRYRDNEDNMSTMGQLSADLTGSVVPALLGVGAVGSMASGIGGRMAAGAGLGAGAGAVQGFMDGEDGLSNRLVSGGIGGVVGGVLGGAMPVVAEAGRSGVRAVRDGLRNRAIGQSVGGKLGVSPEAGRVVSALVGSDDQAAMGEALRRAGPDAMLADASPAMGGVLDATMRTPVPGARVAQDRIASRAGQSYDNVMDAISPQQGPQQSVRGVMEGIRKGSAGARKTAYDAAYSKEVDWKSPAGEDLRRILDTMPKSVMDKARDLRGMDLRLSEVPDSAYPEFADSVVRTSGPKSAINAEKEAVESFFSERAGLTKDVGRMMKRPFTAGIKTKGGIDPRSPAAADLRHRGVTQQTAPGLFRNGGLRDLDNLDADELDPSLAFRKDGTGNYLDRDAAIEAIVRENSSEPVYTPDQEWMVRALDQMDEAVPEYEARKAALQRLDSAPDAPDAPGDAVPMRTVQDIDYIKRALDDVARGEKGMGMMGGQSALGRGAEMRARAVRDALSEAVPEYKNALDTASDAIGRSQAVQFGADLLNPKLTTDEALEKIATSTGGELAAMKEGVRGQLQEVIGNVKAVASDQNVDARQALDAYKRLSSPNAQRKMEALFGDNWPAISQELDRAGSALGLRARTASNSATAGRLFANDLVDGVTQPGALRQGKPLEAAKGMLGGITGASPEAVQALRDRTKSELADLLTRQGGVPAEAITSVVDALMRNPMSMNAGGNTALGLGLATSGAVPVATGSIAELLAN